MGVHVNTFAQGMDKDSSKNKYDNLHYYNAENVRIITQNGLSSGALENVEGNLRRVQLATTGEDNFIVGHVIMRDFLILWTSTNNTSTPSALSTDRIWKVPISSIESLTSTNALALNENWYHLNPSTNHKVFEGNLMLCTGNKVRAVARYESSNIQKVYWIDGYNRIKHLNTVYNAENNNLTTITNDKLEVISDFAITRPELLEYSSGNLRAGKVQYTYQLYVLNGGETVFSPVSHLINLTESDELQSTSDGYTGSALDDNTGKAVRGTIGIDAVGYNRIRVVAIHYTTLQASPEIRVIEEKDISSEGETVTFVDSGQSLMNYTLEQIRILGTYLFIPKEIITKDNILFPANITEESFDISFDARTYRFGGESATTTDPNYQFNSSLRRTCRIYDSEGNYYQGYGSAPNGTWEYYDSTGVAVPANNVTGWGNIPETFDSINRFNDINYDGNHSYRFMYQTDGVKLGGEGPNISYVFKVKTVELDDDYGIQYIRTGREGTAENPSYNNYASPYRCARHLGYARDEVYRYGIVFFDDKGRSSFVKWIGDIRMPSISTKSHEDTYTPDGGVSTPQEDTIRFTDYYYGDFCDYRVQLDNDPAKTAWYRSGVEYDIDDVLVAIEGALGYLQQYVQVLDVDYLLNTIKIRWTQSGTHTITIERYEGTYHQQVMIYYDITNDQAYQGAVGILRNFAPCFYDTSVNKTKMNILYPQFTVDLAGTSAEGLSYQIVRVKRESDDRSIRAQGIVTGTYTSTNNRYPFNWDSYTPWSTDLVCFNSPEVAFNKTIDRQSGDKLQIVGTYGTSDNGVYNTYEYVRKYKGMIALADPQDRSGVATLGDEFYSLNTTTVTSGSIMTMDQPISLIGNVTYNAPMKSSAGVDRNSDKGTNFACLVGSTSWVGHGKGPTERPIVNYRRNVFLYQYGGNSYEARSRNIYMATGRVQKQDYAIIPVYDGDTYISMFDYLNGGWKEESAAGSCDVAIFPVETSINLDLRMDACYHSVKDIPYARFMREVKGVHTNLTNTYDQSTDLYIYNTVYSKENTTKIHIIRPFDWVSETQFDTRVVASLVKTNNELSDSWLKFQVNSYIDVDPQFGEIIALINLNNQMLFFQPKAFGVLSINERALLQTNTISQLSLGTSGVLARFDYGKTEMGLSHRDHIVLTPNGLYWVDVINKAMYKYTSGPEELSLMKAMSSWFRDNLKGSLTLSAIKLFYDPTYKEVNFVDSVQNFNLVYNEITDSFTSFYTYYPAYVINYNDKVLSTTDRLNLYKHNDLFANRCQFYGSISRDPLKIKFLVNPSESDILLFNNLEWLTEVYSGNDNLQETFTSMRVNNDYQDTGTIQLVNGTNIKRRIRKWRTIIPRSVYNEEGGAQSRLDARIRDSYIMLALEFNNTNIRKFVLHDLITFFTTSNR